MDSSEHPSLDDDASRARLQEAVGETYRVERLLGRGGFAEVFAARDPKLERTVAIKVLRADLVVSDTLLQRFQREARAIARLRHPNVVQIYSVGEVGGVAWYVMPYVEGESLHDRLERERRLEPNEAARILAEAAAGLGAAHEAGVVHRDVKPGNILLEGDEMRVVLTDFGIAKALGGEEAALTGTHMFVGTPEYMSPEQAAGDEVDHRSDLYSLGAVAYRMVTGGLPFEGANAQALMAKHLTEEVPPIHTREPECPDRLAAVIDRCLAKDPAQRWEAAADVERALRGEAGAEDWGAALASTPGARTARTGPASTVVDVEAGGEAAEPDAGTPARRDPLPSYRRTLAGLAALLVVMVVVDLAVVGTPAFSLAVLLAGAAVLAGGYRTVAAEGYDLRAVLLPGSADTERRRPATSTEERTYGVHVELVREARRCRADIVRRFHAMSRMEQERFPQLLEAVDVTVSHVRQRARRLATLDERLEHRDQRSRPTGSEWTPDGVLDGEIEEARQRTREELRECIHALEQIRYWLARSRGADSDEIHDELLAAIKRARESVRHRHA